MTTASDYTGRKEKKRKQDFNFDNPQFCGTFQQVMEAQAPSWQPSSLSLPFTFSSVENIKQTVI